MCYTITRLVFKNKLRKADQEKVVALQSKPGCKAQKCFTWVFVEGSAQRCAILQTLVTKRRKCIPKSIEDFKSTWTPVKMLLGNGMLRYWRVAAKQDH